LEKIGKSAYRLKLLKSWNRVHPVFNEVLLTKYHPPNLSLHKPYPSPPGQIMQEGFLNQHGRGLSGQEKGEGEFNTSSDGRITETRRILGT